MASPRIGPALGRRFLLVVLLVAVVPLGAGALWTTQGAARSGRTLLRNQLEAQLNAITREVAPAWMGLRADLLTLGENEPVRLLLRDTTVTQGAPDFVARVFSEMAGFDRVIVRDRLDRARFTLAPVNGSSRAEARGAMTSYRGVQVRLPLTDLAAGDTIGSIEAIVRVAALVPASGREAGAAGPLLAVTTPEGLVMAPPGVDGRLFEDEALRWEGEQWTTVRRRLAEPPLQLALAGALSPYEAPFQQAASRSTLALLFMSALVIAAVVLLTRRLSRDVEREFAQREALAAVGEFASELAHEVRNPLTAMRLDVQRAQEQAHDSETLNIILPRVLRQIERLDRAVSGALRVTRGGSIEPRRVDLQQVLESASRSAEPEFARRGARLVHGEASETGLYLDGDAGSLEQLFLNLLINAAQALAPGGEASFTARREGTNVTITIRDTGVGMTAAQLAEYEQPYRSSRRDGTGLGLKIARRIASNHGGAITFESTPGAGTTALVRLPSA